MQYLAIFTICYLSISLSGGLIIKILEKIGFRQFIRSEGPASHQSKQFTPTAGGIAFVLPIFLILLFLFLFKIGNLSINLLIVFVLLASGSIGFLDDYLKKVKKQNEGLKPKQKLIAQILLAFILALCLNRPENNFFGFELNLVINKYLFWFLFITFVFLVLAGSMNAANLTDGLDGLAASVLGWSYIGLGCLTLIKNPALSIWSFGLAGLCFGFLQINGHPAKVFMGDTGSFLLGGGLGCLALIAKLEWYLLILMLIPIWEVISVIMQIFSCKLSKRFFGKDWRPFKMTPFHHHLELSGLKEKQIVFFMSFAQFLLNALLVIFDHK